ncbi:sulfate transporter [Nitritalea halalkaliphila LW7]|uniref:Sulfate transporter n=1 Tax=Nitritalea halalkaliphila LW7 TaxID=1189621 RepID=I5BWZ7_9BACT|nr:SulP family inorganic anion transporter [Nitritalea halalkaliphila]EIM74099.1 sulfate transporter [Nitritalea halalkaliphila LW7]
MQLSSTSFFKRPYFSLKTELFAGLTTSLALVPEVVAFSLLAGVSPLSGLYTACIIALITALIGGRPGMISGAAGATAIVIVSLVATHGVEYLFIAVILMGLIQVLVGVFKLGKFIRLVPHPVMFGFVNGLAIVIAMTQLEQFKWEPLPGQKEWLSGTALYTMLGLVAATMLLIKFLPKVTKSIPAALLAILGLSLLVHFSPIETRLVGDLASIKGGLPQFHLPLAPLTLETLYIVLPYALIMAGVGLIESLLTLTLVDEITETRGNGNKECVAQGVANMTTGFFGGMGGCAMIGQSLINLKTGGRTRLSGVMAALSLLAFILFFSSYIERIPMAAVVGLMFMVAIGTFEWASLKVFRKVPTHDVLVMVVVTLTTVLLHNLALAVLVGVIISALVFAWQNAKMIRARKHVDARGKKHYAIYGPLFFASTTAFGQKFDPQNDPDEIIIDFSESRIVDHSALDALQKISARYEKLGKRVFIQNVDPSSKILLQKADQLLTLHYLEDAANFRARTAENEKSLV